MTTAQDECGKTLRAHIKYSLLGTKSVLHGNVKENSILDLSAVSFDADSGAQ
jgi:hypothetical protein